jgi:hypothetical protein
MSRKKPNPPATHISQPVKPEAVPGFWEARVFPFLEKRSLVLALCLIAVGCIRIAGTWRELGLVVDEPGHFGCGLEYLARHVYRYETQHPPLARAMTAIGPYLDGVRPTGDPDRENEGTGLLTRSANPDRFVALMRAGTLPFFILACLVVYYWARHAFGNASAALATGLFTLLPPVLAHAGLATTDMGLTACLGAAFLSLVVWAETPTWKHSLLLGLTAAMAALAKFTALGYLPAAAGFALLFHIAVERPGMSKLAALAKERAAMFGLAVLTGALVIWAGYWFSFGKVPGWGMSLPAPEFFDGIHSAFSHNEEGHRAYLLGQMSLKGWWYYFPVVLAVKTPIAFLLLLALGVWVGWRRRAESAYRLPLAFSLGILIPGMTSHVNIGVRHILPIYLGFSILAASGLVLLKEWERTRKWAGIAAALLVVWMAASGARSHPDYLAYFNELVSSEPENVLVDSDFDWGQSTKLLARRLRELGATEVGFGVKNGRSDYMQVWPGLPHIKPIHPAIPAEGWTAVSPTVDKTTQYGLYFRYPNVKPWFDNMQPAERVGSILLYYVPPGSLRRPPSQ